MVNGSFTQTKVKVILKYNTGEQNSMYRKIE